jgi:hypothetical protein
MHPRLLTRFSTPLSNTYSNSLRFVLERKSTVTASNALVREQYDWEIVSVEI